jgi:hypothetical protein
MSKSKDLLAQSQNTIMCPSKVVCLPLNRNFMGNHSLVFFSRTNEVKWKQTMQNWSLNDCCYLLSLVQCCCKGYSLQKYVLTRGSGTHISLYRSTGKIVY